jgi:Protein of unknown function (DUF3105)
MAEGESSSRSRVVAAIVVTVVAAALVGIALLGSSSGGDPRDFEAAKAPPRKHQELRPAVDAAGCELEQLREEGRRETDAPVEYASNPPHSGDHARQPATDAAYYDNPPEDEALVHSLLHGRVLIWFDPSLAEERKARLKAIYDEDPEHVILVPREGMPYEVAVTSWRRRMGCERFTDATFDAVRGFRDAFRDQGLEFVP